MTVAPARARSRSRRLAGAFALWYIAAAFLMVAGPAQGQEEFVEDTVTVASGDYYHEEIFLPDRGSRWEGTIEVLAPVSNIDIYIIYTLDLLAKFPDGAYNPVLMEENISFTGFAFVPPRRSESYSLIIDNQNNSHPGDAVPVGEVRVKLIRTAPLHASPVAQGLLGSLTSVCAVGLAFATIGVAVYLKRKAAKEEVEQVPPRIEIDIPVPAPPRGAWAKPEAPPDTEAAAPEAPSKAEAPP